MKIKLLFSLLALVSFCGCRKLINIDPNYVGQWRSGIYNGRIYTLNIAEDGGAEYERTLTSGGGSYGYGYEHWYGPLKSNGKRFQIAYSSPWFIVLENPVLTNDDCSWLLSSPYGMRDSTYINNNWRIKFKYPKTIGYDGAEVVMYRHQF